MNDKTIVDDSQTKGVEASKSGVERPVLIMLDGDDLKARCKLDEPEMIIGRDLTCHVILSDSKCSRNHAKLTYRNFNSPDETPEVWFTDLNSTNGSFVNGERAREMQLFDGDKILIGATIFGFFLRDETTLKADEMLIRMASYDALTGLHNRGYFNGEMQREFARARRYQRALTLVMFDIDNFKKLNDTFGHQVGDEVLREIGQIVPINCRSNDCSARYGGEEFVLILPETSLENSIIQAERLRESIMNHSFPTPATSITVTVSVGLAALEDTMLRPEELIEAADRALYAAKAEGRNRVCRYNKNNWDLQATAG